MENNPALTIALISGLVTMLGLAVQVIRDRRAASTEDKKVDQAAYDKAVSFYEKQLTYLLGQVERMQVQLEKVTAQLANEQNVSITLRQQVASLQEQVNTLNQTIYALRNRSQAKGSADQG